jgi:hypothetical protein
MICRFLVALLAMVMTPLFVSADTIQTFDVSVLLEVLTSPPNPTHLTGTVAIDITAGTVLSGAVSVSSKNPGGLNFGPMDLFRHFAAPTLFSYFIDFCAPADVLSNGGCGALFARVVLPTDSLVGYNGGPIKSGFVADLTQTYDFLGHDNTLVADGAPVTTAVPEPSSLMLLGSAALLFLGPIRRKLLGFLACSDKKPVTTKNR